MSSVGISEEEAALLSSNLEKLNKLLIKRKDLILDTKFRKEITEYIQDFLYVINIKKKKLTDGYLYRIRIIKEDETRFENLSDLLIPPKDKSEQGRMNNNLRVLYASYAQNIAELECGINKLKVGEKFQVTKFKISEPIRYYYLGMIAEIIFNLPFKSEKQKEAMEELGSKNFDLNYPFFKKIALTESYLAEALYAKNNNNYILSSLISEIIFDYLKDEIDAFVYPSQRNNNGMNIAIKETALKKITPDITFENKVVENYYEKHVKYHTLSFAYLSWSTEKIEYKKEETKSCYW